MSRNEHFDAGAGYRTEVYRDQHGAEVHRLRGDMVVGTMNLHPVNPKKKVYRGAPPGAHSVEGLEVRADLEGQGHATAMWKAAQDAGLNPVHSRDRSEAGDAWATKVGGFTPPLRKGEYAEHFGEWNQMPMEKYDEVSRRLRRH